MTLWLILGAMSAVAVAALLYGLRRTRGTPAARADHDLAVYRAQLRELERDLKRGVLDESELRSARLEIERRMLAADAARDRTEARADGVAARLLPIALILLVPLAAFGVYLWLGNPEVESQPFAERRSEAPAVAGGERPRLPDVETMMARLRDRLADNPDDLQGWLNLGRSSVLLGRYGEAIEAYRRALALNDGLPEVHSALGEARVMAAGGVVTEAAHGDFERALGGNPEDPRARFYLALVRDQDGDRRGALDALVALLSDAPPGASWAEGVRQQAARLAEALGLDPASVLPAAPALPETATREAPAGEASPEEQEAMIRGMVAGLAARLEQEPEDIEGWRMLARSYGVLGETGKAAEAYRRIAELSPDDPQAQLDYATALIDAAGEGGPAPPEAVVLLEKVIAADPQNPDALYYLGEAAHRRGDATSAALYWRRLLVQLPPDADEYAWLRARIDALSPGD